MPQLIASVEGVEVNHVYLTKDRTTLGRKDGNDIVLDNLVVSGRHCVFELKGLADVYLEDLGSTIGGSSASNCGTATRSPSGTSDSSTWLPRANRALARPVPSTPSS
jgi:hypothetical protein